MDPSATTLEDDMNALFSPQVVMAFPPGTSHEDMKVRAAGLIREACGQVEITVDLLLDRDGARFVEAAFILAGRLNRLEALAASAELELMNMRVAVGNLGLDSDLGGHRFMTTLADVRTAACEELESLFPAERFS